MRPAAFKYPFNSPITRCTAVDGIVFVPVRFYENETMRLEHFFTEKYPLHIEYCSGNGDWIVEKAEQNRATNWIAVEMKFDRARKIWSKMKNRSLNNLLIVCGEASLSTKLLVAPNSIQAAYINFPDPWPKKRHWKNRLIASPFLEELYRVLAPESTFTLVTDDIPYSEAAIREVNKHEKFKSHEPIILNEVYGNSYFEKLWRSQGKQVLYHEFKKIFNG